MSYSLIEISEKNKELLEKLLMQSSIVFHIDINEFDLHIKMFQEKYGLIDESVIYHFTGDVYNKCFNIPEPNKKDIKASYIAIPVDYLDKNKCLTELMKTDESSISTKLFKDMVDEDLGAIANLNYNLVNINYKNKNKLFKELYEGSAMTVQGMLLEELNLYVNLFKEKCGLHNNCTIYHFTGNVYNNHYHLTGSNRLPGNLNCIAIKINEMDNCMGVRPLIRWFDDIVDNDLWRERNK